MSAAPVLTPKKLRALRAAALSHGRVPEPIVAGRPQVPAEGGYAAPEPEVVTSSYALAQLTRYMGGKAVHVVNLAPPGVQPQGLPCYRLPGKGPSISAMS